MKKTLLSLLFSVAAFTVYAQKGARLIVRGDDMGYSHSGNLALIKSFKEGIQTSIEIIVPSPWFPEAVKMLKENPGTDIGIHLAITSEWDNVKWRPVSDCPSLRDADGYFYPMIRANKNYPKRAIMDNDWKIADIEKEFRAQIEIALKYLPQISHLSSHMGCTGISPEVKELTRKLAREYKIPIDPEPANLAYAGYAGTHKTPQEKIDSFIGMLNKLESGKTYLFVDHPGLDDEELKAIHHIGYEDVAMDRQGVTDLFTSKKVKDAIKEKGIVLIGYKDLAGQ
ncbi:polysaccharide deacetylase family protein [Dyadobacter sp. CY323]|uniref:polysaccharide deacetylase family protein n=1 Tax=Dyadobacter sp. CY323 TaxID=2907302 RepID=UPI001F39DF70|nr:polysaccharide deacetylase family protein [Dyadobacter sp. CY323]MCE6990126.1 polysaccharide deacetylase family protein [Dyadobacter sp. CY323]